MRTLVFWVLGVVWFAISWHTTHAQDADFLLGTGIWDVTGPAQGVGMMGYAMPQQTTAGIHFRQRARAFIIVNVATKQRLVFVNSDTCMVMHAVKYGVMELLQQTFGPDLYTWENVMLSGTHTHSGPGGYSWYPLYDLTTWGFHKPTYDAVVNGIFAAIVQAHENLQPGRLYLATGELLNANINRSPTAYANNPPDEISQYEYNVDKNTTLLRFDSVNGTSLGFIHWFAVHGTSMNNTNQLISGDNKGYAAYLTEKYFNGNNSFPGVGPFVAAFAQSNEGDVSPNTRGAFCPDGTPCNAPHSTCNGRNEGCHGYGPGATDFESTAIIGTYQFESAVELFANSANNASDSELSGKVFRYIHAWVDMSSVDVATAYLPAGWTNPNTSTCTGALGDAFAAGTTDGPGAFNFQQGTNGSGNPFWNFLGNLLSEPTQEQRTCQYPKPILINSGGIDEPAPWTPRVLPLQIFQIGKFVLVGVPCEFTTMAGRRLRSTVREALIASGNPGVANVDSLVVVIAGLANAYSQYVTTPEEYAVQRYEGASTLFGPLTLPAYQMLYAAMVDALATGTPPPPPLMPNAAPPNYANWTFCLQPGNLLDTRPDGIQFGDVAEDVGSAQFEPGDVVTATFWGASPSNDLMTQSTFLAVQWWNVQTGEWNTVRVDGDVDTKFYWQRKGLTESLVTVEWDIPTWWQIPGKYRLSTYGYSRDLLGVLTPYTGVSSAFEVVVYS